MKSTGKAVVKTTGVGVDPKSRYDKDGREIMDPIPMAQKVDFDRAPTLRDQVINMIRSEELKKWAENQGVDTFEEYDDFEIPDDESEDPFAKNAPWELEFDPGSGKEMMKAEKAALDSARNEFDQQFKAHMEKNRPKKTEPEAPKKQKKAKQQELLEEDDE